MITRFTVDDDDVDDEYIILPVDYSIHDYSPVNLLASAILFISNRIPLVTKIFRLPHSNCP